MKTNPIATVPHSPSDAEFEAALASLVESVADKRNVGRSVGAIIRWRYRSRWTREDCDRLQRETLIKVKQLNLSTGREERGPTISGEWLTVDQVARLTGRTAETVKRRLRTREGRRDLGWAWWDGYQWLIPSPAVDPTRRAGYMASLPEEEPYSPPSFVRSQTNLLPSMSAGCSTALPCPTNPSTKCRKVG